MYDGTSKKNNTSPKINKYFTSIDRREFYLKNYAKLVVVGSIGENLVFFIT